MDDALFFLEEGLDLVTLVEGIVRSAVMEGIHSIDVGILVLPVLVEMMMLVGDSAGVKYDSGLSKEAPMNEKRTRSTLVAKTARKLQKQLNEMESNKEDKPMVDEPIEMEEEEMPEEKPKGLMGRRK